MSVVKRLHALPTTGMERDISAGKGCRILVVGDVMLDRYWFGDVSRISPEAPVPVVKIDRIEERPGGAANVARNVASLGARASLLSVVGNDEPGARLKALLKLSGVDARLHPDPGLDTTVKLRVIGRQQQLLRLDFEKQPSREILASKLSEFSRMLQKCQVLILSDYGKGGLTHIVRMIAMAKQRGKIILVDPKGSDYRRYKGATVITPNKAELRDVIGTWHSEADLNRKAQALRRKLGLEAILLTRSEEGMTLFSSQGAHHQAAVAREVYDVSGAGDTVIATFAMMLALGAGVQRAMQIANLAAGVVVGKLGTAAVSLEELQRAMQEQGEA